MTERTRSTSFYEEVGKSVIVSKEGFDVVYEGKTFHYTRIEPNDIYNTNTQFYFSFETKGWIKRREWWSEAPIAKKDFVEVIEERVAKMNDVLLMSYNIRDCVAVVKKEPFVCWVAMREFGISVNETIRNLYEEDGDSDCSTMCIYFLKALTRFCDLINSYQNVYFKDVLVRNVCFYGDALIVIDEENYMNKKDDVATQMHAKDCFNKGVQSLRDCVADKDGGGMLYSTFYLYHFIRRRTDEFDVYSTRLFQVSWQPSRQSIEWKDSLWCLC